MKSVVNNLYETHQSELQQIRITDFVSNGIELWIKRDDLIDKQVSGNKWRKLKYELIHAQHLKKSGILTCGGAYSNHLIATAAACHKLGLKSIGLVRGEELNATSNKLLATCTELGMYLEFIPRAEYAERDEKERQEIWKQRFPDYHWVAEGGKGYHAMIGCQEIWKELPKDFDAVFVAQGTTTTSCGLLLGAPEQTKIHVVPVLKGFDADAEMRSLLYYALLDHETVDEFMQKVVIHPDYHFGGYAQTNPDYEAWLNDIQLQLNIPLDKVYTGKAMYALIDQLNQYSNWKNKKVLFLHTGGVFDWSKV